MNRIMKSPRKYRRRQGSPLVDTRSGGRFEGQDVFEKTFSEEKEENPYQAADQQPDDEYPFRERAEAGPVGHDDVLGLYLKQMGAIPRLSWEQEQEMTRRLDTQRRRAGQRLGAGPGGGDV